MERTLTSLLRLNDPVAGERTSATVARVAEHGPRASLAPDRPSLRRRNDEDGEHVSIARIALLVAGALFLSTEARADQILANAEAFQTLPGTASVTLPGIGVVPLEGAEFSPAGTSPYYPLSAAEVTRLNTLAPNLGLVTYSLQWVDEHGSVVGPTSVHKVGQELVPTINTTPNFDTVVQRLDTLTFTAAGQVQETQIRILMLDLQSVAPVVIGGFHYEMVAILANGSPVYDSTDTMHPQYLGNLKFDATAVTAAGVFGTLDLGVTGPTPTASNLGADLPSGMEGLPVNFDIQFIPLDGGPTINPMQSEVIFQNTGPSSFGPVPEPSSLALLLTAAVAISGRFAWRNRRAA